MSTTNRFPFVEDKPCMALVVINWQNQKVETGLNRNTERPIVSQVAKRIDTTYAHACKLISKLEDMGYVTSDPQGRKKYLELTERGQEKAGDLEKLLDLQDNSDSLVA